MDEVRMDQVPVDGRRLDQVPADGLPVDQVPVDGVRLDQVPVDDPARKAVSAGSSEIVVRDETAMRKRRAVSLYVALVGLPAAGACVAAGVACLLYTSD